MAYYPDPEDELIPEPVYFRLGDSNFRKMEDIENQILGDEEEEDLSDSEMEVTDLTAPPSQSYARTFLPSTSLTHAPHLQK